MFVKFVSSYVCFRDFAIKAMVRTLKSVAAASLAGENMASKKGGSRAVSAAVMSVALDCAEDKQLKALRQAQYQYVLNCIAENADLVLPRLIAALDADKNKRENICCEKLPPLWRHQRGDLLSSALPLPSLCSVRGNWNSSRRFASNSCQCPWCEEKTQNFQIQTH